MYINCEYYQDLNGNLRLEHVRHTARNGRGYEIYALSDSADMKNNYSDYIELLDSIVLYDNVSTGMEKNATSVNLGSGLRIFPNPVQKSLNIIPSDNVLEIKIYNPHGRLLKSFKPAELIKYDFGYEKPAGIYLVKYRTEGSKLFNYEKVIRIK